MKMDKIITATGLLLLFSQVLLSADKSVRQAAEEAEVLKKFVPAKVRQDAPKWAVDYFARVDAERLRICQNCLETLSQEKSAMLNAKRTRGDKKTRDAAVAKEKEKADQARELLRITLNDARSAVPFMEHVSSVDLPKVGDTGKLSQLVVKQVIGIEKALMITAVLDAHRSLTDKFAFLFILKGVSTKGWVDGGNKTLSIPLYVSGTETYKTTTGSNTVHVLEAFDPEDFLDDDDARATAEAKDIKRRRDGFTGRWKIVNDKGVVGSYFTLDNSFTAKKSHVPDATGEWEIVGNEARITWSDGWKDILRPEKDRIAKIAFGPGTSWDDKPADSQFAVKEAK